MPFSGVGKSASILPLRTATKPPFRSMIAFAAAAYVELRKTKIAARQEDNMRQLVRRYEELAEKTLDAQQRTAADVAELRARATSIEQILRTVE